MSCKKFMPVDAKRKLPRPECRKCKHSFTPTGYQKHRKQACQKRQRFDSRVTCDCGFTLKMNDVSNQACEVCEHMSQYYDHIETPVIKLHGFYSEVRREEFKDEYRIQIFQGAYLAKLQEHSMNSRINETVAMNLIPDDPKYNTLRRTMQDLTAYQSCARTFCEHSEFWKLLRNHSRKCKLIKEIPKDARENMMRILNLSPLNTPTTINANILYWFVLSPHAAAVHDVDMNNYFPVHPILSLFNYTRVWSSHKNPSMRIQSIHLGSSFFKCLERRIPPKKGFQHESETPKNIPFVFK